MFLVMKRKDMNIYAIYEHGENGVDIAKVGVN